ncbi:GGDEF domain-containing protein [Neiella marina]|uniref:diguanylate cyclase n=1 Tax=Neiella marina TaxID=508461 RepID=A0A8J2XPV7_9GAMM|nr:GGDEF domain-containing protein [Neiella marina]GGA80216.1 GGDEF domain-containing protein [Neiella marina]
MNKHLVIDINSGHPMAVSSDQSYLGGASTASLGTSNGILELDCELDNSAYAWPYCRMSFDLSVSSNGVDIASYETIRFKASIDGPKPQLRAYLISSVSMDKTELADDHRKYHMVTYEPTRYDNDITVPLELFRPAPWWLTKNNKGLLDSVAELDNVLTLELGTGSNAPPGRYKIKLERIELQGKWFPPRQFYLLIIGMWILFACILGWSHVRTTKRQLSATLAKTNQLQQINEALHLQSKTYQQASQRDPLTGLYNRGVLRERVPNWVNRVIDHDDRLSLIFFDLDHFKAINDSHSHDVGDNVLVQLAKLCREQIRHQDLLVRWGGEEFAIFCPQTELQSAELMANKIRNAIRLTEWPNGLKVTASFGVSEYYAGEPFTDFVNRADKALYFSKDRGRDMVSVTGLD